MLTADRLANRTVNRVGGTIIPLDDDVYIVVTESAILCFWGGYPVTVHVLSDNIELSPWSIWNDDNWKELIDYLQTM